MKVLCGLGERYSAPQPQPHPARARLPAAVIPPGTRATPVSRSALFRRCPKGARHLSLPFRAPRAHGLSGARKKTKHPKTQRNNPAKIPPQTETQNKENPRMPAKVARNQRVKRNGCSYGMAGDPAIAHLMFTERAQDSGPLLSSTT